MKNARFLLNLKTLAKFVKVIYTELVDKYGREDWLKIIERYDEDFKMCDYTPDELEELINAFKNSNEKFKDEYFAFYDDVKSSSRKKQDW